MRTDGHVRTGRFKGVQFGEVQHPSGDLIACGDDHPAGDDNMLHLLLDRTFREEHTGLRRCDGHDVHHHLDHHVYLLQSAGEADQRDAREEKE